MDSCPKCSSGNISGPFYRKDEYDEFLLYRCNRCGYTSQEETHDSPRRQKNLEAASRRWMQ